MPKWAIDRHITLMGCLSADGRVSTPMLIVQGQRLKAAWTASWPEALWVVDSAGYCSEEIYYQWVERWVMESVPEGGYAANPRVLIVDNYHSHLSVDVLQLLRAHNVRCVTLHPHTTHILCVLDTSVFALLKKHFKGRCNDFDTEITMNSVGGVIKDAYAYATSVTECPVSKKRTSAAISGYASTGLFPFDPSKGLQPKFFEASTIYAQSSAKIFAAAGKSLTPKASVRPTPAQLEKIAQDFKDQHLAIVLGSNTAFKVGGSARPKMVAELATGSDFIARVEAKDKAKAEEAEASIERKKLAAAKKAINDAEKAARKQRVAAKKAAREQRAAEAAAKALLPPAAAKTAAAAKPVQKKGRKRKLPAALAAVGAAEGAFRPKKRQR